MNINVYVPASSRRRERSHLRDSVSLLCMLVPVTMVDIYYRIHDIVQN